MKIGASALGLWLGKSLGPKWPKSSLHDLMIRFNL